MKATWYIISGMRVKFVYECHGVKVKVTGAKKGKKNPYSRNVKLRSDITPVPLNIEP